MFLSCTIHCFDTIGGVDYAPGPYAVVFTAGEVIALFDFLIFNDNIMEGSETFTLTINSSSTPDGVSGGQAAVTIMDDDSELFACKIKTHYVMWS